VGDFFLHVYFPVSGVIFCPPNALFRALPPPPRFPSPSSAHSSRWKADATDLSYIFDEDSLLLKATSSSECLVFFIVNAPSPASVHDEWSDVPVPLMSRTLADTKQHGAAYDAGRLYVRTGGHEDGTLIRVKFA